MDWRLTDGFAYLIVPDIKVVDYLSRRQRTDQFKFRHILV